MLIEEKGKESEEVLQLRQYGVMRPEDWGLVSSHRDKVRRSLLSPASTRNHVHTS